MMALSISACEVALAECTTLLESRLVLRSGRGSCCTQNASHGIERAESAVCPPRHGSHPTSRCSEDIERRLRLNQTTRRLRTPETLPEGDKLIWAGMRNAPQGCLLRKAQASEQLAARVRSSR